MSLSFKFIPSLVLLAIGFSLIVTHQSYERDKARIDANSASTMAQVLKKSVEAGPGPGPQSSKDVKKRHLVTYRFTVPGAAPVEGTADLDQVLFDKLTEGGPLAVRYRVDEPSLYMLEESGIIVSGSTQIARTEGSGPLFAAAAMAALAVIWLLIAPRLKRR